MDKKNNTVNLQVIRILEASRDVELHLAELYRLFSELFSTDKLVSQLWIKTCQEEENHASQFVLAINLRKEMIVESVNMDLSHAENALALVKSVYEGVRENPPTVLDALRLAVKLEVKLSEFHMQTIANFTDGSMKNVFTAMMKADQKHIEALEEAYNNALSGR
jgi:rubrerythrin